MAPTQLRRRDRFHRRVSCHHHFAAIRNRMITSFFFSRSEAPQSWKALGIQGPPNSMVPPFGCRQAGGRPPGARFPPPGSGASLLSMVRAADPSTRTIPRFPADSSVGLRVSVKLGIGHSSHPQTIPEVDKGKIRPFVNIGSLHDLVVRRRSTCHVSTDRSLVGSLPRLVEAPAGMSCLP